MAPRQPCKHERLRFLGIQRLGKLPPIELWQCSACKNTVAKETDKGQAAKSEAAA